MFKVNNLNTKTTSKASNTHLESPEAVTRGVLQKKKCSEKFRKIHRKTPVLESLFCLRTATSLQKRRPHEVFSREFCEISKNTSGRLLLNPHSVNN